LERRSRGKLIAIAGTAGALLGVYLLEKAQAKPVTPPTVITPPTPTVVTPTVTLPSECAEFMNMGPAEFNNAESALMNAIKHYEEQIEQLQKLSVYNDKYVVVTKTGGPLYAPYWAGNIKYVEINEPLLGGVVAFYDTESDAEMARQAWLVYQPTAYVMKFSDYLSSVIAAYQRALDANKAELDRMERCRSVMEQIWSEQLARILGS
jgi:hypothetical protein